MQGDDGGQGVPSRTRRMYAVPAEGGTRGDISPPWRTRRASLARARTGTIGAIAY